jgi:PAS domain S-box-containing protein
VLDAGGRIVRANATALRRLGYAEAQLVGQSVLVVHPPERREEAGRIVADMLAGKTRSCPVPLQTSSGGLIPVETRVMPGFWGGRPALFGVSRDVTEREIAAADLRNERDFARLVMDTMAEGLTVTNADGAFEYVNPAYARMLGVSPESILGRKPVEFTAPEARSGLQTAHAERRAGLVTSYDSVLADADGHRIPVMIAGAPRWRDGEIAGAIAVVTDLTGLRRAEEERLELERKLLQAEKRASLGTMAGGIAHTLNNLLTAIIGNIDLATAPDVGRAEARRFLGDAAAAARRAAGLGEVMLTYIGAHVMTREHVSLTREVVRVLALLRPDLPAGIRIDVERSPDDIAVMAGPAR